MQKLAFCSYHITSSLSSLFCLFERFASLSFFECSLRLGCSDADVGVASASSVFCCVGFLFAIVGAMSWASVLPNELTLTPLPFVVLTGLDVKHNAVHKEIWDGFNLRTNLKFRYNLFEGDHDYPKPKNKVA